jgi:hypothetical protein
VRITSAFRRKTIGKDTRRIAPYLPSFAAEFNKRDWSGHRVYRREGIGAKLLDREQLATEMPRRNYTHGTAQKILGGNLMRELKLTLPQN